MICPNCGKENPETAHGCESCGIIFIKWMIQRFRSRHKYEKRRGFRLPKEFSRTALAAAFLFGLCGGIAVAVLLGDLPGGTEAAFETPSSGYIRSRISDIMEEASGRAAASGAKISPEDLEPYFLQGFESLERADLAEAAGPDAPKTAPSGPDEFSKLKETPFRCRAGGAWAYLPAPPDSPGFSSSCWALGRTFRKRNGVAVYWDYFWTEMRWAPKKRRWAVFTRRQEIALLKRYMETELGPASEARDAEESKELLAKGDRAEAVRTAFRTRLRRAGLEALLERLSR